MSWTDTQVAVSDVLMGRLVVESMYAADNGKRIVVEGTTTGHTSEKKLTDRIAIFELPAKERYKVTMISTGDGAEYEDYTEYVVVQAGDYDRVLIDLSTSGEEEEGHLSIASWEKVQSILDAHNESKVFHIGDEVELYLEDDAHTYHPMIVAAINHDEEYPHQLIFVSKYLLPEAMQYNPTQTTAGGWPASKIRQDLNGEKFYDLLPEKLRNMIVERKTATTAGQHSRVLAESEDKIWIPRDVELYMPKEESTFTEEAPAGVQFPLFFTPGSKLKTCADGTVIDYWCLMTPGYYAQGSNTMRAVASASGATTVVWPERYMGMLPCFHLVAKDTMLAKEVLGGD